MVIFPSDTLSVINPITISDITVTIVSFTNFIIPFLNYPCFGSKSFLLSAYTPLLIPNPPQLCWSLGGRDFQLLLANPIVMLTEAYHH